MSALNLAGALTDLAAAVQTVLAADRKSHAVPVEGVVPGDAINTVEPGDNPITGTFRRGMDRVTLATWIICGLPQDWTTWVAVSAWLDNSSSAVTAIEGYVSSVWASARVVSWSVDQYQPIGSPVLVALKLSTDILF